MYLGLNLFISLEIFGAILTTVSPAAFAVIKQLVRPAKRKGKPRFTVAKKQLKEEKRKKKERRKKKKKEK